MQVQSKKGFHSTKASWYNMTRAEIPSYARGRNVNKHLQVLAVEGTREWRSQNRINRIRLMHSASELKSLKAST